MPNNQELTIIVNLRDLASRGLRNMTRGFELSRVALRRTTQAMFSLQGVVTSLVATTGLAAVARSSINVASSFEQMRIRLDALTEGRGTETLERLNTWAKEMPVNTQQAVDTFVMMQAMGLDPTIEKMNTLVDVSVQFGGDAMPRVARALGQMASLGRLSAEELNQLSEVGINARKILTDAFGKTVEEIQKSNIEIQDIIEVLWRGLDARFSGAAQQAQRTWNGLMIQLQSEFVDLQKTVMESGLFDFMKAALAEVVEIVRSYANNAERARETGQRLQGLLENIIRAGGIASDVFDGWKVIFNGIKALLGGIGLAFTMMAEQVVSLVTFVPRQIESALRSFGVEVSLITDAVGTINTELEIAQGYFAEVATNAADAAVNIASGMNGLQNANILIENIRQRTLDWAIAQQKVKEETEKTSDAGQRITTPAGPSVGEAQAAQAIFEARAETERQRLEMAYEEQEISLQEYINRRRELLEQGLAKELELIRIRIEAAKNEEEKTVLRGQEIVAEERHQQQLLALTRERIDKEKALEQSKVAVTKTATSQIGGLFRNLYEATGRQMRAFFALYKAAAIAETIIDVYKGAQKAFTSQAAIPIIGVKLGYIEAAAAIASGLARVAMIAQQSFAKGGEILGMSPSPTADNVPIMATAGEWVHPVKAVKHYGRSFMESVRNLSFPKPPGFAEGGMVGANLSTVQATESAQGNIQDQISIINVVDPTMMGQYLASNPGTRQVVNIISENKAVVRNALFNSDG